MKQTAIDQIKEAPKRGPLAYFLYLGVCETTGGNAMHAYQEVEQTENSWKEKKSETMLFKKRWLVMQPGTIVSLHWGPEPGDIGNAVLPGTAKYEGHWPDEQRRIGLITQSRAVEHAREEARRMKELLTENAATERLEPFKRAYKASSPSVRRQILAEIIRYITT